MPSLHAHLLFGWQRTFSSWTCRLRSFEIWPWSREVLFLRSFIGFIACCQPFTFFKLPWFWSRFNIYILVIIGSRHCFFLLFKSVEIAFLATEKSSRFHKGGGFLLILSGHIILEVLPIIVPFTDIVKFLNSKIVMDVHFILFSIRLNIN